MRRTDIMGGDELLPRKLNDNPYRGELVKARRAANGNIYFDCERLGIRGKTSRAELELWIDRKLATQPQGSSGFDHDAITGPSELPSDPESQRQWIGVYVDSDEEAAMLLAALHQMKEGTRNIHRPAFHIPSLDWDNFEPSSPEDEAWRNQ